MRDVAKAKRRDRLLARFFRFVGHFAPGLLISPKYLSQSVIAWFRPCRTSKTPPASRSPALPEPEGLPDFGMLGQLGAQPIEIPGPQRHGAPAGDAGCGVREAHEALPA